MSRAANFAPGDSFKLLCWICPAGGLGISEDLHSSCQVIDGNLHRFFVLFVGFPTCARLDVYLQRYATRLMRPCTHRIFDGAAERLDQVPDDNWEHACRHRTVSFVSLPECGFRSLPSSGRSRPRGQSGVCRFFRDVRLESSLPFGRFAVEGQRRRSRSSSPSIWRLAGTANQRAGQACCWLCQVS